jgi:demethylmenaquinone methyltransferase/2-methoxy-6-polyprenyl-1,4-benzoquinol methylase
MIPYLSKYLRQKGAIVALDYSEKMIDVARKKFPRSENPHLKFFAEDIHNLPMNSQYDAILCYSCFPHFIDQKAAIQHMSSGLAPNGKLMIAHSESRDAINNLHKRAGAEVCEDFLPTSNEIETMMIFAGLQIAETIDNDELFIVMGEKG